MQEREFDTHFVFTIGILVHGRDEEGAIDNTRDYFSEEFVNGIGHQLNSLVDYEPEVVGEIKNGLFEVTLRWSGYWTLDAKDKEEARLLAEKELDHLLTPVYQTIENFADDNSYFKFNGNMTGKVTDIVEYGTAAPAEVADIIEFRTATPEEITELNMQLFKDELFNQYVVVPINFNEGEHSITTFIFSTRQVASVNAALEIYKTYSSLYSEGTYGGAFEEYLREKGIVYTAV